jgi:hypothetical protein
MRGKLSRCQRDQLIRNYNIGVHLDVAAAAAPMIGSIAQP